MRPADRGATFLPGACCFVVLRAQCTPHKRWRPAKFAVTVHTRRHAGVCWGMKPHLAGVDRALGMGRGENGVSMHIHTAGTPQEQRWFWWIIPQCVHEGAWGVAQTTLFLRPVLSPISLSPNTAPEKFFEPGTEGAKSSCAVWSEMGILMPFGMDPTAAHTAPLKNPTKGMPCTQYEVLVSAKTRTLLLAPFDKCWVPCWGFF